MAVHECRVAQVHLDVFEEGALSSEREMLEKASPTQKMRPVVILQRA